MFEKLACLLAHWHRYFGWVGVGGALFWVGGVG